MIKKERLTNKDIVKYISDHAYIIESSLGMFKNRITSEEIKDVRQELLITMLKCLRKYTPLLNNTFDMYVIKSITLKATGILGECLRRKKPKYSSVIESIENIGEAYDFDQVDDFLCERVTDEEIWDAKITMDKLLLKFPQELREIIKERMSGETLQDVGNRHNISYETVRIKTKQAIKEMRQLIN